MRLFLLTLLLAAPGALAQRGVPQNGFPSWHERTMLVLVNRSRADPVADPKACTATTVRPPLLWNYNLNRSARFHSTHMQKSGQFMHNSPCVLATDISTTFTPGTQCDGAVSCACSTGAVTCTAAQNTAGTCAAGSFSTWSQRVSAFGTAPNAENIASGYGSPRIAHNGWMNSSGHCANILGGATELGVGHSATGSYWTENFSGGGTLMGSLIAGTHEPQMPSSAPVEFRANYYDLAGGPQEAQLNLDGTCTAMALERGTQTNGTWLLSQVLSGTTCRRYVFTFKDPSGTVVKLPESGSYGAGPTGCEDWLATAPAACAGTGNAAPTIATAASATPNPVTGSTTALSVLGADELGEPALVYTWAATGPGAVSYAANGTNAARDTTATFTQVGSYPFTVTVRDADGLTVSSQVTVVVTPTASTLSVSPASSTVAPGQAADFIATLADQFGAASSAAVTWSVSGGGTIDGTGRFTAGQTVGGPYTVTATAGGRTGTAQVSVSTVILPPLTVLLTAPQDGAQVFGRVALSASTSDDARVSFVVFLVDGVSVMRSLAAPWTGEWNSALVSDGVHRLSAQATDGTGETVTSPEIEVTVGSVPENPLGGDPEESVLGGCGCSSPDMMLLGVLSALLLRQRRRRRSPSPRGGEGRGEG